MKTKHDIRPFCWSYYDLALIKLKGGKKTRIIGYKGVVFMPKYFTKALRLIYSMLNNHAHKQCLCQLFFNSLHPQTLCHYSWQTMAQPDSSTHFQSETELQILAVGWEGKREACFMSLCRLLGRGSAEGRLFRFSVISECLWLLRPETERCLRGQVQFGLCEANTCKQFSKKHLGVIP